MTTLVRYLWVLGLIQLIKLSEVGLAQAVNMPSDCSKKRQIFNLSWGIISDGEGRYPQDSHCEWLIVAGTKGHIINLNFTEMLTECSYDYVFVYDGASYNSTLLGSFSGNTLPSPIYAKSGKMLILLFSDTNYVQTGFTAEFSVTVCPFNCSRNGRCENNRCICDDMWMGQYCSLRRCPDDCWESNGHGICQRVPSPAKCICNPGYSGQSCSLGINDDTGNRWHLLAPSETGLTSRTGHAAAYLPLYDCLFVFGGFTLNDYLGDLVMYNFSSSEWRTLEPRGKRPSARYGHAIVAYGDSLVIYGGQLRNEKFPNELWIYDVKKNIWILQRIRGNLKPPGLVKHTLTVVDDWFIYLFGGSRENGLFSSEMYRINLKEDPVSWERVYPLGGKELDRRLVGHSTVFHPESRSLIVYGGIAVDVAKFSKLSDKIHIFNVDTKYWSLVNYSISESESDKHVPTERAFHSANIMGNYMVLYGGYTHLHTKVEICYDQKLYFYNLKCHIWINSEAFNHEFPGNNNPTGQGSFSHVAAVRNGNTLLIVGGYSGTVRGELLAYTVLSDISLRESRSNFNMTDLCLRHQNQNSCKANPECGWCPGLQNTGNEACLSPGLFQSCRLTVERNECPGLCPLLTDCQACLAIGGLSHVPSHSENTQPLRTPCAWCVQRAECYPQGKPVGICAFDPSNTNDSAGWWGPNATRIMNLEECRFKDFRPGLTMLKYRHPPNWNQPDEVSIINSTIEHIYFVPEFPGHREQEAGGEYIVRFRGYIHPLGRITKSEKQFRLFIATTLVRAVLWMSVNESKQYLEIVANHSTGSRKYSTEAYRSDNKTLFPEVSRGHKYLIDYDVRFNIKTDASGLDEPAIVKLIWNGGFPHFRKELTFEFLEPFNEGPCSSYNNCLECIADAACGWCELLSSCLERISEGGSGLCANVVQTQYLIIQPRDCIICSDHIYCENCTKVPHCEWIVADSHCVRRGRFNDAVRDITSCPSSCNERKNCSSCLGDPGLCAWCEHTQECFLFSTYISEYLYGMCREWVDEDRIVEHGRSQCRNCSSHERCKDCLSDLRCGWCGNVHNTVKGECVDGDFQGAFRGLCHISESAYAVTDHEWSYGTCPDIEECLLGLHDCHPNATCTNTFESFICSCNRGFRGDGKKSCIKTCDENCIHGTCSEAPTYKCICQLGWTGPDCSINCGCHNHSTCEKGPYKCDKCQNWTEGHFCERCKAGSFGNATTIEGCNECNCNEHGNKSEGYCDMNSGKCFCQDQTEGDHCENCQTGYYGDPRNGSQCYLHCGSRQVLTSVKKGGLGLQSGISSSTSCLWILTVHPELQENLFLRDSGTPSILLSIHADMNIRCSENYIYVFDGLPSFVSKDLHWNWQNKLLGAFCGSNFSQSIVLEAKSGYLTVFYQRDDPSQGFNSTYYVPSCSEPCPVNRTCMQDWCQCLPKHAGVDCSLRMCPNNCSGRGTCIQAYGVCVCDDYFGGPDCSEVLYSDEISQSLLTSPYLLAPAVEHLAMALPRFGHSLSIDSHGNLWLFGGYSLSSGVVNDVFYYNATKYQWDSIIPKGSVVIPKARYFHAAVYNKNKQEQGEIYILGGMTQKEILGDFWKFMTNSYQWKRLSSPNLITGIAGHTLTLCDGNKFVLIGGFDTHQGFLDKTYEYEISTRQWNAIDVIGTVPIGIYGHSTVYNPATHTFYVFGGIVYKVNKTVVSNDLYALHYPTKRWTILPPFHVFEERYRYLHVAVSMDDYMVVFGGRSKNGNIAKSVLIYSYACNTWIDASAQGKKIVGESYEPAIGQSVVRKDNSTYIFGGFAGRMLGNLLKIVFPADLCSLFTSEKECSQALGCLFCSIPHSNHSSCYSSKNCSSSDGNLERSSNAQQCNKELIERRNCDQYTTCSECLAIWPHYPNAKNMCQWCFSCKRNHCISLTSACEEENCHLLKQVIRDSHNCQERICAASDCEKCREIKHCVWTRQKVRSSDFSRISSANNKPIYDWNCRKKIPSTFPAVSMPPLACPPRCSQHKDCRSCLESAGAEGGWHECRWSEALKECISPSYQPIRCAGGVCEQVLRGSSEQCPKKCSEFLQCSHCISHPQCGWCAFSPNTEDGQGACMEGGLHGPNEGLCNPSNISYHGQELPTNITNRSQINSPEWAYLKCPPENECFNNHHTCNKRSEECLDLLEGFSCHCRKGYEKKGKHCQPDCNKGCISGKCIAPDLCECHFGYVGVNCSTQCQCNGHSNCAGLDQLDECLECHNDTQGKQCDTCQPLFVGDPRNNGKCISCYTYCNGHTKWCVGAEHYNETLQLMTSESEFNENFPHLYMMQGPVSNAICIMCKNNTHKEQCDECLSGFFRTTENPQEACRPCECHGHGNICDPVSGEKCNCQNNTETDQQCSQKNKKDQPCWKLQCSKCKESFLGTPTGGHQCYKQMFVDRDYCFDRIIQDSCFSPDPLLSGRSVFFAVHPKYMNVDIRIVLDVAQGGVDLYFSPKEDTFVVDVNRTNGVHIINFDPKYNIEFSSSKERGKRKARDSKFPLDDMTMEIGFNITDKSPLYKVVEKMASGLSTFVTITDPYEFLIVRNIQNRLVITLPEDVHDLRSIRFYMVLIGVGSPTSNVTYGSLFFRQDQPRIDLFVFFSVFFSCFFLLLAVGVVVWKGKQAIDIRRARQRQAVEMEHMASRPFARVSVIIDEEVELMSYSPSLYGKKTRSGKHIHNKDSPKIHVDDKFSIRPVAIEPTDDGIAAIGTLLIQLPGGNTAPLKLTLGSSLVTMRVYPNTYSSIKACMRRRTSYHST